MTRSQRYFLLDLAAIRVGIALGIGRAFRRRWVWPFGVALSFTVGVALIERSMASLGALDRAVTAEARMILPLLGLALNGEFTGHERFQRLVSPIGRYGLDRFSAALGVGLFAMATGALGSWTVFVVGLFASGGGAGALVHEFVTLSWIAMLAGATYGAAFLLGSTFFRFGRGRWLIVAADLLFAGATGQIAGFVTPQNHVQNLLGAPAPLGVTQAASSLSLAMIALLSWVLAAKRAAS